MPADQIEQVYQRVRAQLLARFFAAGRYFPAFHFSNGNVLGEWPGCRLPAKDKAEPERIRCNTAGCVPRLSIPVAGEVEWKRRYDSAAALLALTPAGQQVERWRVWRRDRTNPLMMAGLRITQLAIEHRLGSLEAGKAIERWLDTVENLFKVRDRDSRFAGYVLRWDPSTSDHWEAQVDAKGVETPQRPCEFLLNPDPRDAKERPFLYCTPARDSRYPRGDDAGARDRFRRWEPSIDEYTGLVVACLEAHEAFAADADADDEPTRQRAERVAGKVRAHMRRVARYLQAFAYVIVRPCGGVTFRGAGENNPCLEYPYSLAFKRILGDGFRVTGTFEDAMQAAGLAECVFGNYLGDLSPVLDLLASRFPAVFGSEPANRLRALGVNAAELARAAMLTQRSFCFDVNDQDEAGSNFALCYLMSKIARRDPAFAFNAWMTSGQHSDFAHDYKIQLGLIGHAADDDTVRTSYFAYYDRINAELAAGGEAITRSDREQALPTAVALLLSRPPIIDAPAGIPPDHTSLTATVRLRGEVLGHLKGMAKVLHDTFLSAPLLSDDSDGIGYADTEEPGKCCKPEISPPPKLVFEYGDKVGSWHGFLTAAAVTWLHARRTRLTFPWLHFAEPARDSILSWDPVILPADVAAQAHDERLQIPKPWLQRAGQPARAVRLLDDPPPPPSDAELGQFELPRGQVHTFDLTGGLTDHYETLRFPIPPPPVRSAQWDQDHELVVMPNITLAYKAALFLPHRRDGESIVFDVLLQRFLERPWGLARLRGEVVLSWVRRA